MVLVSATVAPNPTKVKSSQILYTFIILSLSPLSLHTRIQTHTPTAQVTTNLLVLVSRISLKTTSKFNNPLKGLIGLGI